jgi:hypothetical protein
MPSSTYVTIVFRKITVKGLQIEIIRSLTRPISDATEGQQNDHWDVFNDFGRTAAL